MSLQPKIDAYLSTLSEGKRKDLEVLQQLARKVLPEGRLWFEDGKDASGKTISNPNIGYGCYSIQYANGKTRDFYQIGLSANTSGISVYIMGIPDKKDLTQKFGKEIGKASVTGYCIKFKSLQDIQVEVLEAAMRYGVSMTS